MWCESVIRNVAEPDADGRAVDYVELAWTKCRNVVRATTASGEPVRILLPAGERLRDGDVIFEDATRLVVIRALTCELIVATPGDPRQGLHLAMELGNLHLPVEIDGHQLSFIEDTQAMTVLEAMRIPWVREVRRFDPTAILSAPSVNRNNIQVIRSENREAGSSRKQGDTETRQTLAPVRE